MWLWLGGCALGIFILDVIQRTYFPNSRTGLVALPSIKSMRITSPLLQIKIPRFSNYHKNWKKSLYTTDPGKLEKEIRAKLSDTHSETGKMWMVCYLAQILLLKEERQEARAMLSEEFNRLSHDAAHWTEDQSQAAGMVLQFLVMLSLQEGRVALATETLAKATSYLGDIPWINRLKAESDLIRGEFQSAQLQLESCLNDPDLPVSEYNRVVLLLVEVAIQEQSIQKLVLYLSKVKAQTNLEIDERVTLARVRYERAYLEGDLASCWKYLALLGEYLKEYPGHHGIRRLLQTGCARIHLAEGNFPEVHRRLQLAENDARYPMARWEIQRLLGILLEREKRLFEATMVWKKLADEGRGTLFGKQALVHLNSLRDQLLSESSLFNSMTSKV